MAQIDFEALKARMKENEERNAQRSGPGVGFFALKNDKDEALVRFMHDTPATFDIVACHPMKINDRFRKVNCIRSAKDPVDNCPLCAAGINLQYRFYIHLIEYTCDDKGNIIATPKVWERSTAYVDTFNNLINNYGPLSENLFKVVRNGQKGAMDTTYDIFFAPPMQYKPELYPKNTEFFANYKALGTAVIDGDYNTLAKYVNGDVEEATSAAQPMTQPAVQQTTVAPTPVNTTGAQPVRTYSPTMVNTQPQPNTAVTNNDGFQRPRRFYNN